MPRPQIATSWKCPWSATLRPTPSPSNTRPPAPRAPRRQPVALLGDRRILFSRYLSSFDCRSVRLRPRDGRDAAVVVAADPRDLGAYSLVPVEVAGELARARDNLAGFDITEIAATDGERATFERLISALPSAPDVLYIVARDHELPGGAIMMVIRQISLEAIAADNREITDNDLTRAIRRELAKEGRTS